MQSLTRSKTRFRLGAAILLFLFALALMSAVPATAWLFGRTLPQADQLKAMINACQITTSFEKPDPRGIASRLLCPKRLGPSGFPMHLVSALAASEDRRFLSHDGIDQSSIVRAFRSKFQSGGSTITQQLARTLFLTEIPVLGSDRRGRAVRKIQEWRLALLIEDILEKDEILLAYLNAAPFNPGIFGFDAAARLHFGKPAAKLDLMEAAALVAMLPAPNHRDPSTPEGAAGLAAGTERVLHVMRELELIDTAQLSKSLKSIDVRFRKPAVSGRGMKPVVSAVIDIEFRRIRDLAQQELRASGVAEANRIFVTMDAQMQLLADQATASPPPGMDMAAVVLGEDSRVLAIAGGKYVSSSWNPAWNAQRSIGSLGKPILYSVAIEHPDSMPRRWSVAPMNGYNPAETRAACRDRLSLTTYLKHSCNRPFVAVARAEPAASSARVRDLGLVPPTNPDLIATGGIHANPMDVASAFNAFKNEGILRRPYVLIGALAGRGNVIAMPNPPTGVRALSKETALEVVSALEQPTSPGGTARAAIGAKKSAKVRGKTGTSDGARDAWFTGWTKDWTASILAWKEAPGPGNPAGAIFPATRFGLIVDRYWPENPEEVQAGQLRNLADSVYGRWLHLFWTKALTITSIAFLTLTACLVVPWPKPRKNIEEIGEAAVDLRTEP